MRVAKTGKITFCVYMKKLLDSKGLARVTYQPFRTDLYNRAPLSQLAAATFEALPALMTAHHKEW